MTTEQKAKWKKIGWAILGVASFGLVCYGCYSYGYDDGADQGHEQGFKEGFDAGSKDAGAKKYYWDGVNDTVRATHRFLYNPERYESSASKVSENVIVYARDLSSHLNEDHAKALDEEMGEGWKARLVIVGKPIGYEEDRHIVGNSPVIKADPVLNLETPETEDIPETAELSMEAL